MNFHNVFFGLTGNFVINHNGLLSKTLKQNFLTKIFLILEVSAVVFNKLILPGNLNVVEGKWCLGPFISIDQCGLWMVWWLRAVWQKKTKCAIYLLAEFLIEVLLLQTLSALNLKNPIRPSSL